MIVRTDAVVLRAFDYGETSVIATLFTRRSGTISVLARGARRPKSRFGSTLQPMAYVQVVYYEKNTRTLQTLKEASHLQRFPRLSSDLERLTTAMRLVELVRATMHEGDSHPSVLRLIVESFNWLNDSPEQWRNTLPWFQLRLAALQGFTPNIDRGELNGLAEGGGVLSLETGAIAIRERASGSGVPASRAALRAFAILARTDLQTSARLALQPAIRREVEKLIDTYVDYHSEGASPDRVRQVVKQLEDSVRPATSSSNLPEPSTENVG
ncbi:MAG: DNA repair protein RecO [Rubricoccaceae bacterium]|nr:DNA repair protein RecO [Rubricoccaceae bacterium]